MEAVFVGRLNDSNNKIEGTWRQGGREFPLVLDRATGAPERLRPQTARSPCSYQVEEVGDPRQTGKLNLAGTLTIPKAEGLAANQKYAKRKVAGIVLVSDNESWVGTGRSGSTGVMTAWEAFVVNQRFVAEVEAIEL